jgi:2-desacetyl-2-hydroxyethyl bacteriochlorophyllide A dehydrogenase
MRAVRAIAPGEVEVTDVAEPAANGEMLVRIRQAGICGSDLKMLAGKVKIAHPRTLGHEAVGEVVFAPPGAPHEVGTTVLIDPAFSCGWCDLCLVDRTNLCRNGGLMGRDVDGVFTELVSVPANRLVPVPATVSVEAAGLLQVLGTCVHASRRIAPFPGQVAAVIGLGVAGQLLSQILTRRGIRVVGITRSEWKRDLALRLGAEAVAPPADAGPLLDDLTEGRGPDVVVEAVGTAATLAQAIELVGIGGAVLAYGSIPVGDQGLPYYQLYKKELTIHHPRAAQIGDYVLGVDMAAAGDLQLEPIVSHVLSLEDGPQAFDLVNDPSSLKVLLRVD